MLSLVIVLSMGMTLNEMVNISVTKDKQMSVTQAYMRL